MWLNLDHFFSWVEIPNPWSKLRPCTVALTLAEPRLIPLAPPQLKRLDFHIDNTTPRDAPPLSEFTHRQQCLLPANALPFRHPLPGEVWANKALALQRQSNELSEAGAYYTTDIQLYCTCHLSFSRCTKPTAVDNYVSVGKSVPGRMRPPLNMCSRT